MAPPSIRLPGWNVTAGRLLVSGGVDGGPRESLPRAVPLLLMEVWRFNPGGYQPPDPVTEKDRPGFLGGLLTTVESLFGEIGDVATHSTSWNRCVVSCTSCTPPAP